VRERGQEGRERVGGREGGGKGSLPPLSLPLPLSLSPCLPLSPPLPASSLRSSPLLSCSSPLLSPRLASPQDSPLPSPPLPSPPFLPALPIPPPFSRLSPPANRYCSEKSKGRRQSTISRPEAARGGQGGQAGSREGGRAARGGGEAALRPDDVRPLSGRRPAVVRPFPGRRPAVVPRFLLSSLRARQASPIFSVLSLPPLPSSLPPSLPSSLAPPRLSRSPAPKTTVPHETAYGILLGSRTRRLYRAKRQFRGIWLVGFFCSARCFYCYLQDRRGACLFRIGFCRTPWLYGFRAPGLERTHRMALGHHFFALVGMPNGPSVPRLNLKVEPTLADFRSGARCPSVPSTRRPWGRLFSQKADFCTRVYGRVAYVRVG
jgi:hypothetical protein